MNGFVKSFINQSIMPSQILETKLNIPVLRSDLVQRPRLFEMLDRSLSRKLTLISAPAGFGKSTLISEWLKSRGRETQFAWVSLDSGDNDPTRFLSYLVAAIQTIDRKFGESVLVSLHSPGAVKNEVILTALLNDLNEIPEPVLLVLDDYHLIESQQIDKAVAFLLNHLPSHIHLVISSRIDPDLPLAKIRASGQMLEIRANDLRFSSSEAKLLLDEFHLSTEEIEALETRTEGWITGLQLVILSMQGVADKQDFITCFTGSNRFILDYLGEEVLSHQPQEVNDFLLKTSILNRLSAPLCDAIRQKSDSKQLLDNLEKQNLFIIALDSEGIWNRYHHLFSDLLRRKLKQYSPELEPQLHQRAFAWYQSQNDFNGAIHHAFAGGDFENCAVLIEDYGLSLIGQGAFYTVQTWIDALPENITHKRPYLEIFLAWASNFTQELSKIETHLQQTEGALKELDLSPDDQTVKDLTGQIKTLRAWNARRDRDNQQAIRLLEQAITLLKDNNSFVETFADLNLGLAYLDEGELLLAADSFRNTIRQGKISGNELASLMAVSHLAAVLILQGRLNEAANLCRNAINEQLELHKKAPPTLCLVYVRLAWVLAEWNDVDGYFKNLSRGIILADQIGFDSVVSAGTISLIWEKEVVEQQGYTINFSDEVNSVIDRFSETQNEPVMAQQNIDDDAHLQVIEEQNVEVYLADNAYFEVWPGYSEIALAKKMFAEGKKDEALSLLESVYDSARDVKGTGLMIEARASAALIYQAEGELDKALKALEEALSLGESEGYMRTYLDRDAKMEKLIKEAVSRGIMPHYTKKILNAYHVKDQEKNPSADIPPYESLTPRELEVLQLVAQGLSNKEISVRLYLALSTVKGHNQRIFEKLQVQRRTEAVAKAQEMGLL